MSFNPDAVIVGAGTLYVASIGTAEPTDASTTLPSAWRQVGYTEEGSQFTRDLTSESIFVAETTDALRTDVTEAVAKIAFSMAEMTRANLILALNGGNTTVNNDTSVGPPALGAESRVMIALNTQQGARWLFRKCFNTGGLSTDFKKSPDKRLLPVEFALELPTSGDPFTVFPTAAGLI